MYDIPIERGFHQLSNGIRHVLPSTDRSLELKAKDIDGSDRLTAGCVLIDLASPAVSWRAVYANGLKCVFIVHGVYTIRGLSIGCSCHFLLIGV